MFNKIMILAATTSFIALAAPQTALAQGIPPSPGVSETLAEFKERCRAEDADRAILEGASYIDQVGKQAGKAGDFRELEQNARNDAGAASSKESKANFERIAEIYAKLAKAAEDSARRDLERAKEAFDKVRADARCTDIAKDEMDLLIIGGEVAVGADKAEAEKIEKAEPAPRQEKKKVAGKKPPKIEKPKKVNRVNRSEEAGQEVAQAVAQEAFLVGAQMLFGEMGGMDRKHKKHHKAERRETMDGMAMEEFQPRRKMKNKKFKKLMNFSMF